MGSGRFETKETEVIEITKYTASCKILLTCVFKSCFETKNASDIHRNVTISLLRP
jgi:hypothetical protein